MFQKLSDNLNRLMGDAKLNASELARLTGIPASTIKKIRNRDNPNPTLMTLLPIASYFNQTLTDLVGDETQTRHVCSTANQHKMTALKIPLIQWKDAVNWPMILADHDTNLIINNTYSDKSYALKIEQRDWVGFNEQGLLIVDPTLTPTHRDYVIVNKHGQSIPTLRQLITDDGEAFFRSIIEGNHALIPASEYQLLGKVVEYRNTFL